MPLHLTRWSKLLRLFKPKKSPIAVPTPIDGLGIAAIDPMCEDFVPHKEGQSAMNNLKQTVTQNTSDLESLSEKGINSIADNAFKPRLSIIDCQESELLIIEGGSGSGKSMLAKKLHDNIPKSILINSGERSNYTHDSLYLDLTYKSRTTLIVDELHYCEDEVIWGLFKRRNAILFINTLNDLPEELKDDLLTRQKTEVEQDSIISEAKKRLNIKGR